MGLPLRQPWALRRFRNSLESPLALSLTSLASFITRSWQLRVSAAPAPWIPTQELPRPPFPNLQLPGDRLACEGLGN